MSEHESAAILAWINRFRAGDAVAADELFRTIGGRLEELARRMLAGFPNVRRHADPVDVAQGASMRLLNALRDLRPESARAFFDLAAMQIRRELLDLARHFASRESAAIETGDGQYDPDDRAPAADELDLWSRFHQAVERLPVEEREAIGLIFYHGRTRAEAAAILGVSERTVHRWWQSGRERLTERLGSELPM